MLSSETLSRPLNEKERLLLRQGLGLHEKKIYISINTLSMVKQNLALLDLWKSMPQETLLLLFVDGTNKHFYQERIQKRHLTNVKLLLGEKRDDVLKYLRIADAALWTDEEDFFTIIESGKDYKKEERMKCFKESIVNTDGTCGTKVHSYIKNQLR